MEKLPVFNVNRIGPVVVLSMNVEMANELFDRLDEFDDLDTYSYTLRQKLGNTIQRQATQNTAKAA